MLYYVACIFHFLLISISLTLGTYGPATVKGATTILAQYLLGEVVVILNNTYYLSANHSFYTHTLCGADHFFSKSLIALHTVLYDNDISVAMRFMLGHVFFSLSQRSYK